MFERLYSAYNPLSSVPTSAQQSVDDDLLLLTVASVSLFRMFTCKLVVREAKEAPRALLASTPLGEYWHGARRRRGDRSWDE